MKLKKILLYIKIANTLRSFAIKSTTKDTTTRSLTSLKNENGFFIFVWKFCVQNPILCFCFGVFTSLCLFSFVFQFFFIVEYYFCYLRHFVPLFVTSKFSRFQKPDENESKTMLRLGSKTQFNLSCQ